MVSDNPFGVRLLDLQPVTQGIMSAAQAGRSGCVFQPS